jgi:hypothetical protein
MPKPIDELIAKYGLPSLREKMPRPAAREAARLAREPKPKAGPEPGSSRQPSPRGSRRDVEGLEWIDFEGAGVLRMAGPPTNYVACPSGSRLGTFEIYRRHPRELVVQRMKKKYVLGQIMSLIRQDEVEAERAERWKQEAETKEREEIRRSENQPGFYLLPGEEDPADPEKRIPIGPFWKFEAAGSRYSPEDLDDDRFEDEDVEDWAVEYLAAERKKPVAEHQPTMIVEARNAMDAAGGKGHVWWQDGVFRGPPVDPRQAGWGWWWLVSVTKDHVDTWL